LKTNRGLATSWFIRTGVGGNSKTRITACPVFSGKKLDFKDSL